MSAEHVLLVPIPIAGNFSVQSLAPVPIFVAVALPAQQIRFREGNDVTGNEAQGVAIVGVVTVQAPALPLRMIQHDVRVLVRQCPSLQIGCRVGMTVGAGKDPLRERGGGTGNVSGGFAFFS